MKKKVIIVLGTRPEAIKLARVIFELKKNSKLNVTVCAFKQHGEMLQQVLQTFSIKPNINLPISLSDKDLFGSGLNPLKKSITLLKSGYGFLKFYKIIKQEEPKLLVVQGDTSTALLAGIISFLLRVPVAHIEAGLRTYDKYSPFPEEINRQFLARLADINFTPTQTAKENLLAENIPSKKIYNVGNTEIDSLVWFLDQCKKTRVCKKIENDIQTHYHIRLDSDKKIVLATAHRRESFGEGLQNICQALKEIAQQRKDVIVIMPVHSNPNVQRMIRDQLKNIINIYLTPPLPYRTFVYLMSKSYLILSDSGGIQEAAPTLNKPVLVLRNKTERNEGVTIGTSILVGTNMKKIVSSTLALLDNPKLYSSMIGKKNPYGDGRASIRIARIIENYLKIHS